MGGRRKPPLLKWGRINDIGQMLSKLRSRCQGKALMAGTPHGKSPALAGQTPGQSTHLVRHDLMAFGQRRDDAGICSGTICHSFPVIRTFGRCLWHCRLAHDHGQGIAVDHFLLEHRKAAVVQQRPQRIEGVIGNVVPDQFVIAALLQDIFQARHRHKSHAVLCQIVPDGLQHDIRSWLML